MMGSAQAAVFNNAGVRLLTAGETKVAQDLFRAALEMISVNANSTQQFSVLQENEQVFDSNDGNGVGGRDRGGEMCVTPPECVTTAEEHLTRFDSYLSSGGASEDESVVCDDSFTENLPGEAVTCRDEENTRDDEEPLKIFRNHGNLFVYSLPFELPNESNENRSKELESAIIVFNLALSHSLVEEEPQAQQCYDDAYSPKIGVPLYHIVDRLLESSQVPSGHDLVTDLLRIAVWNNMSVWCHEHGLLEDRTLYLQRLLHVFQYWQAQICPVTMQGVRWNLWSLLTLPPASYTTTPSREDQGY
jgi:hypothetical protein